MSSTSLPKLRDEIAYNVLRLRKARRFTQAELAARLEVSQGQLSRLEHGDGSFSAEQLLTVLKIFNVGVSQLVADHSDSASELQNVLARLGASHLAERDDLLPSERLDEVRAAVREALVLGSPRLLTATAPVIVAHIDRVGFPKLHQEAADAGISNRLGWLLDNTRDAVQSEQKTKLERPWKLIYRRAELLLSEGTPARPRERDAVDFLDVTIRTKATLDEVLSSRSRISKRWNIASALRPRDFAQALRAARGVD